MLGDYNDTDIADDTETADDTEPPGDTETLDDTDAADDTDIAIESVRPAVIWVCTFMYPPPVRDTSDA